MSLQRSSSWEAWGVVRVSLPSVCPVSPRRAALLALLTVAAAGCGPFDGPVLAVGDVAGSTRGGGSGPRASGGASEGLEEALPPSDEGGAEVLTDVRGHLVLERALLFSATNTIRCIRAPCFSNAVNAWLAFDYTVRNDGRERVTHISPSGCQTVARVLDASGKLVKDAGRACPFDAAEVSWSLEPGEARTLADRVELVGDDGEQLAGEYLLQVQLRTVGPREPVAPAQAAFEVALR